MLIIVKRARFITKDLHHFVDKIQYVSLNHLLEGFLSFGIYKAHLKVKQLGHA